MSGYKRFKDWTPTQAFLLPPSPLEWLPEGHLVYFILDVLKQLDLGKIRVVIDQKDARGTQPYDPRMMVALLLYGYSVGVYSSRKLERATYEDVGFRVLAGGQHPHFTTINEFRKIYLRVLRGLFLQILRLCQKTGMVKLGHVALDGTKLQGNASKHKAMSYKRMTEEERRLQAEIDEMLSRAEKTDREEDARFGEGEREEDLPAELRRRESRLERIRRAKEELEAEAKLARARALREQAKKAGKRAENRSNPVERKRAATFSANRLKKARELDGEHDDDDTAPPITDDGLPMHEPPVTVQGEPDGKAQRNFTDPDSRIMESGGTFLQGYNCQAAVDESYQIIVGQAVTNKCPDNGNLVPMLEKVQDNCGDTPEKVSADAGYWNPLAPQECEKLGIDVYISTERRKHSGSSHEGSTGPPDQEDAGERERMRSKLRTSQGREIYARRKVIVEPVFGQIKEARGFRRFLSRGLTAVQAEWAFLCAVHNLNKLFLAMPERAGSAAA